MSSFSKPIPPAKRTQNFLQPWLLNLALSGVCVVMLYPILSTLLLSIKEQGDVRRKPPILFPCDTASNSFDPTACRFSLEGYGRIFLPQPDPASAVGVRITGRIFTQYLPNTLLYATASALLVTLLAGMAAYVFSRVRFWGRRFLLVGILALAGVPLLTMLLALYRMNIGLRGLFPGYDERIFMIIVYVGFDLPFAIWIAKGFFDVIPRELEEAALIDGATPFDILWRVFLPLMMPAAVTTGLLAFIVAWNEFLFALTYTLTNEKRTVPVAIALMSGSSAFELPWGMIMAASVIVTVPVVILVLVFQRRIVAGLTAGAVKG